MTVLELIAILSALPDKSLPVILSSDEEGNSYRDLYGVQTDKQEFFDGRAESVIAEEDWSEYDGDELRDVVVLW